MVHTAHVAGARRSLRLCALLLVLTGFGACRDSTGSAPATASSSTAVGTADSTNGAPIASGRLAGVPASSVDADAPFQLVVEPSMAHPGGRVEVRLTGDLPESGLSSIAVNLDELIDGAWRTTWVLTDDDWGSDTLQVSAEPGATGPAVLGVGMPLDTPLQVTVPQEIRAGNHRLCRTVTLPEGVSRFYVCSAFTVAS